MIKSKYYKQRKELLERGIVTGLDRHTSAMVYQAAIRDKKLPVRIKHGGNGLKKCSYDVKI